MGDELKREEFLQLMMEFKNVVKDIGGKKQPFNWTSLFTNLAAALIVGIFGAYMTVTLTINDIEHNIKTNKNNIESVRNLCKKELDKKLSISNYKHHIIMDNHNFKVLKNKFNIELIEHDLESGELTFN